MDSEIVYKYIEDRLSPKDYEKILIQEMKVEDNSLEMEGDDLIISPSKLVYLRQGETYFSQRSLENEQEKKEKEIKKKKRKNMKKKMKKKEKKLI